MKFFQDFRYDEQQNIVKRTPPPRWIRILKQAWQQEKDYTNLFGDHPDGRFLRHHYRDMPVLDTSHSSILHPFYRTSQTIPVRDLKSDPCSVIKFKYDLPLKKIDPDILTSAVASEPKVNRKTLVNLINHLHFINGQVSIHVQDKMTGEAFLQQGEPGPYLDDKVTIKFTESGSFDVNRHIPRHLVIDHRKSLVIFPMDVKFVNEELIVVSIPDKAYSYSKRQAVRHTCEGVNAEIVQGQVKIHGVLEDINASNLRIDLHGTDDFNPAYPLFLKLSQCNHAHFMGECRVVRSDHAGSYIILQPVHHNCPVLKSRKYASDRVRITPQPMIHFTHPLCGLALQYKVEDISASGFSVIVPDNESLMIPGMIIPQITIQLPGMLSHLQCTAQVIYRHQQKNHLVKYGLYILDMPLHDQRRLFDAVSKTIDPHVNVTGRVNMDSLWELFFDSGFIYPDKYGIISPHTETLKETYRKLYEEGQDIFTHLTYQEQGRIFGHISMIKAYEDSWIIHHLAARPMRGKRTGLMTLNHFINYLDCLYRLPVSSKNMRYNFCYFRPENKFSDYYFGGVCKIFNHRSTCSVDLFGYMAMSVEFKNDMLPVDWSMDYFSKGDLIHLRDFYNKTGGGMMLDAFALESRAAESEKIAGTVLGKPFQDNNIQRLYNKVGLQRQSKVYSLRHKGLVKAVLMVDSSDLGINMSELLNSIKIIIIDRTVPWSVLQDAVNRAGKVYGTETIMSLIYPYEYLGQHGIECKKRYYLWVLNTNLDSEAMDIIKERARINPRKFITETFIKNFISKRWGKVQQKISIKHE